MNQRQRQKMIPSTWIIAIKQTEARKYYALYAIDWKRGARLSWEGWNSLADLQQFHIPIKRKTGGTKSSFQPAAKIAKKALYLHLDETQYGKLEQLFYQPFSKKQWRSFIEVHSNNHM